MKEINASASPKYCRDQEQIYFNTVKLQNTNSDRAIVPKRMGQTKKFLRYCVIVSRYFNCNGRLLRKCVSKFILVVDCIICIVRSDCINSVSMNRVM